MGLSLDASRDELLRLVGEQVSAAWTSFDQARPTQPPVAPELQALLCSSLPEAPTTLERALRETADILDQSLAQTRPRWFAFIGSAGLEGGVVGGMLAASFRVKPAGGAAGANGGGAQGPGGAGGLGGRPLRWRGA